MSHDWYLREDGETFGPYPKSQLISLAKSGRLSPTTRVRNGEVGDWQRAADVPGLFRPADAPLGSKPPARAKAMSSQEPAIPLKLILIAGGAVAGLLTTGALVAWFVIFAVSSKEPAVATTPEDAAPVATTPSEADQTTDADAVAVEEPAPTPTTTEPPAKEPAADVASASSSESGEQPEVDLLEQEQEPILPLLADDEDEVDESPQAVAVETRTRTDAQVTEFNKRVKLSRRASDAYAQYKSFSTRYEFTAPQRTRIDVELAEWKKKADKNLCRLGSKWVIEREMLSAEQEAQELMRTAVERLSELYFDECIKLLNKASDANPNGIRADYTLGLLYSLPFAGVKAPDKAENHFRTVLQRCPDHPAALNSLAIAQIKQRDYGAAAGTLTKAASLSPSDEEIIQNVGRFIMLAEAQRMPAPNDGVVRRFRTLYKELTEGSKERQFDARTGWLHMLPVFSADESLEDPDKPKPQQPQPKPAADDLVAISGGTGFVVAPGYVLTNRHVVDDDRYSMGIATEIRTLDPVDAARKRELRGKVVATSKDADLALVRFENLNATPLPFAKAPLELASDVLILGYPQTQILGTGLKTTRGIVSALPDTTRPVAPEYVLFDAVADHGNSGGPIVDRNACVVGVLTIGLAELSGGLTAESASTFIKQHVPGTDEPEKDAEAPATEGDWAAITRKISPSVLQLTCYYDAGIPELSVAARGKQHSDNVYEDQTCPWCNGRSRIACPARGCVSGRISVPYTVEERVGQLVVSHKKTRKEACRNCDGHGHVDCIGCRNGFDQGLR